MTEEKHGKKRTVLVAVDGSEHSERAFDCKYEILRDLCLSDTSLVQSDFIYILHTYLHFSSLFDSTN